MGSGPVSGFGLVIGAVVAFFVVGIVVGVIAVIAMSAIRTDRYRRNDPGRRPDDEGDHYPRWPGGSQS